MGQAVVARFRRLPHQGAALVYGALVGTLLAVALSVLWVCVRLLPDARLVDRVVRRSCRIVLALAGCPLRVEGLENLPVTGPVLFAANHASYLDAVALLAAIPASFQSSWISWSNLAISCRRGLAPWRQG